MLVILGFIFKKNMITIIDYGLSNVNSIFSKLKNCNFDCLVSRNRQDIENASKIILPGVGYFKTAIENIKKKEIFEVIIEKVKFLKTPILGICLGMQLLAEYSEEGDCEGLNLLSGINKKFDKHLISPNVGWFPLEIKKYNSPLLINQQVNQKYYFTHSFYMDCLEEIVVAESSNDTFAFPAIISKDNIYGVQFHPEKSHEIGFEIIKNFILYA